MGFVDGGDLFYFPKHLILPAWIFGSSSHPCLGAMHEVVLSANPLLQRAARLAGCRALSAALLGEFPAASAPQLRGMLIRGNLLYPRGRKELGSSRCSPPQQEPCLGLLLLSVVPLSISLHGMWGTCWC